MLNSKKIMEVRDFLEESQNPVFFFDNDPDGLCSFLLLRRFLGRGKGVAIKSYPELDERYFDKVREFGSDCIFILDKALVSDGFFERAEEMNVPVVWIDHHEQAENFPENVNYYNPVENGSGKNIPTTLICYEVVKNISDMWIAVIGSISDGLIPDFYNDFLKKYPDLGRESKNSLEILYKSEIGRISRIFSAGLKNSISNVVEMMKFLIESESPYDILGDSKKMINTNKRFEYIEKRREKLISQAIRDFDNEEVLFFKYGGDMSISADLANELMYRFPNKTVIVAYIRGANVNISARGDNVKDLILSSISSIEGASGGGHRDAVGAQMGLDNLDFFEKRVRGLLD